MISAVVVAVLVAAFVLVAAVAAWAVRRLWTATGPVGEAADEPVTTPADATPEA